MARLPGWVTGVNQSSWLPPTTTSMGRSATILMISSQETTSSVAPRSVIDGAHRDGWQVCCRLWGVVWVGCGVVVVGVGWWWIWCVVVVGVMFLKRSGAG